MEDEMIAVIAACVVCFLLGIVIATFIGCYCGQRLRKKKEDHEDSRRKSSINEWTTKVSPLVASESGYSEGHHRLGAYQPKILGRSISQEHLIFENSKNKSRKEESKRTVDLRRYSSASDIRITEIDGRNVSVVEVKNRNVTTGSMNGRYGYYNGGAIVPGYMVGNHIYPEQPSQRAVRQGQIVVARPVSGAEETTTSSVISGHQTSSHVTTALQTQTSTSAVQQVFSEVSLEDRPPSQEITTFTEESSTSPITTTTIVSTPTEIVTSELQHCESSTHVTEQTQTTTQTVTTTSDEIQQEVVLPSATTQQLVSRFEERQASSHADGLFSHKTEKIVVGKGAMTNVRIFSETQTNASAVMQNSDIARPPRWMEEQFEENSRSMEFEEEEGIETDEVTSQEMITTYGAVRAVNTGVQGGPTLGTVVSNTTEEAEVVIEDFVDPEPRPVRMLQPSAYVEQTIHVDKPADQSTTSRLVTTTTTEVTKTTHQLVNESAERVPPAFTSTPRAPPDETQQQGSVTTFGVTSLGPILTEDIKNRRQRVADDGSVSTMPPSTSDLPL